MRQLVELVRLSHHERRELIELLTASEIAHTETATNFLARGAIWVDESQLGKASEILETLAKRSAVLAQERRKDWNVEWDAKWGGSHFRWLVNQVKSPARVFRLALLAIMLWLFVWYPIYFVLKSI